MKILAVETTGKFGSASVITDDGITYSASSGNEMNHLTDIIAMCDDALGMAGISKKELTHVAASVGPGSFTGIRIGVTTARTLGQMLGIPCIGVSSLEAMALRVLDHAVEHGADIIVPVINARRHQAYAGIWQAAYTSDYENKTIVPAGDERQYMIEELLEILKQRYGYNSVRMDANKDEGMAEPVILFTGDGADAYGDIITESLNRESNTSGGEHGTAIFGFAPENLRYQNAEDVARIALRKAKGGQIVQYDDLMPEYMRLSEAEQRLKAGTLSDKISKLR